MSEFQFVHFQALDRPLDDRQLAFMEDQSSRATITKWEFTNTYHYGDFHGDPIKMLRRGYDIHLHYANFGIRRLMIRLPGGLPGGKAALKPYLLEDCVEWQADKKGDAGILAIEPEADAGTFGEDLYDVEELLSEIAPIRDMIAEGDLRPLYLAWLACAWDEESLEPPVPAGLKELPAALRSMATFYEVSQDLIAAAAENSPQAPCEDDRGQAVASWLAGQSLDDLRGLVQRLLSEDAVVCRAETLAQIRQASGAANWPTARGTRTLGDLQELAEGVALRRRAQEKKAREEARRKRLADILANPAKSLAKVDELVAMRSVNSYEQAAQMLVELKEALGPGGEAKASEAAARLRRIYPKAHHLTAALRRAGLTS